jgi:hypothetical protein
MIRPHVLEAPLFALIIGKDLAANAAEKAARAGRPQEMAAALSLEAELEAELKRRELEAQPIW